MSSKAKGSKGSSSGRKKDHSISEETPTASTVLLPQHENIPEQSSVDEVVKGQDVDSLYIHPEELSKLYPAAPPPSHKKFKKVLVKRRRESDGKDCQRNVTVLHPLPPNTAVAALRILGSPNPGPRFDATNTFIQHSVLAPSESYAADLYKQDELAWPPPIVVPDMPLEKQQVEKSYQTVILPRETHALEQWNRSMEDRKLQQNMLSKKLNTSPEMLAMNHGEGFRMVQEEREAIDRAIYPLDRGKGYRIGSEFWQQEVNIGDFDTGIRMTLTRTEKGLPPELEFVGTPAFVRREKGLSRMEAPLYHAWRQSAYLAERRNQLDLTLRDIETFHPAIEVLEVIGHTPWKKQGRQRADSLDSDTDDNDVDGGALGSVEGDDIAPLSDERSQLGTQTIGSPGVGPALRIGQHLVKWEGLPEKLEGCEQARGRPLQKAPIEFRVLFEAGIEERVTSYQKFENCGSTAIYFSWQYLPRPNPHSIQHDCMQRFYFDTRGGVLLPGESVAFPFLFKSPNPGVFMETWGLQTGPTLAQGRPMVFVLRGIAFREDLSVEGRNATEGMLVKQAAMDAAEDIMKQIVESICTPVHTPEPVELYNMEEDIFMQKNPGFFYHHNIVLKLKALYDSILRPPTVKEEGVADSKVAKKTDVKASSKDKNPPKDKREPDSKKGKQPTIQEEQSGDSQDGIEAFQPHPEIPNWDLSITSLQEIIMKIEDEALKEENLKELSMIMGSLSFPPHKEAKIKLYPTCYEILCKAVDSMVSISIHLSQVIGVPLKEFTSVSKSVEPEQVDSVPSSPVQSKKDKKSAKDAVKKPDSRQKGKEKEKEKEKDKDKLIANVNSTSSKAKGVPGKKSKGNVKDLDKEGEVENLPPSEADPTLQKKYKDSLYTAMYEILCTAVDKMALLFQDL